MSGKYDKDPSVILARDLLGKVICYKKSENEPEIKYMITVTEAYPYDDKNSYIYREIHKEKINKNGKAFNILSQEKNVGKWFLYGGMLHIISDGSKCNDINGNTIFCCGNVLIRGGIRVVKNDLKYEDKRLEYEFGKPYSLCRYKLNFLENAENAFEPLKHGITIEPKKNCNCSVKTTYRYGLPYESVQEKCDDVLRFYLELDKYAKETN